MIDLSSGYIGVMIDDLVTKGTDEPYRIFTSRCEYRLILREDNADLRLRKIGFEVGLVSEEEYMKTCEKQNKIEEESQRLSSSFITPKKDVNDKLASWGSAPLRKSITLKELLARNEIDYLKILEIADLTPLNELKADEIFQVELNAKYAGFIERQSEEIEKFRTLETVKIPLNLDYKLIKGLSREVVERLEKARPVSLGQASRIAGVTPAALWALTVFLKKGRKNRYTPEEAAGRLPGDDGL